MRSTGIGVMSLRRISVNVTKPVWHWPKPERCCKPSSMLTPWTPSSIRPARFASLRPLWGQIVYDDERQSYATHCPDCGAYFFEDEEGFDQEECIECGEPNCFEVNA